MEATALTREQQTWLPRRNPFCPSCRHPPDGPRVPSYDPEGNCACQCHDSPEGGDR